MSSSHAERGQALPLAVGLAALGAIALLMLFNGGQTAAAKARLTHAADATAYSGALVQARALNMLAYTNRSLIAHQVAMAHLVTLASWAQFGQAEARQLLRRNPPASVIGMLFGPQHGLAYAGAAGAVSLQDSLLAFGQAYARHDSVVHSVLGRAARDVLRSLPESRNQAMQAVVRANFPEFGSPAMAVQPSQAEPAPDRIGLAIRSDDWPGFVQRYAGHVGGALRPMVARATHGYGFLRRRNHAAYSPWPASFRCPSWRHELRRNGATSMDAAGRWRAVDTQSFQKVRSNQYIGCYYREYPMGWGKVSVRSGGGSRDPRAMQAPNDFSRQDFWRWVHEHTSWDIFSASTNWLAYLHALNGEIRWRARGLPSYHEIPMARAHAPARISLTLRQPAQLLPTTDARARIIAPLARFAYAGLDSHQAVTVASSAETYFERPVQRRDGRIELATLFRPYWQARLSAAPSQPGPHRAVFPRTGPRQMASPAFNPRQASPQSLAAAGKS